MHDFFVLSATTIPILLVAGSITTDRLHFYSISKRSSYLHEIEVAVSLCGIIVAIVGAAFAEEGSWLEAVCWLLTIAALTSVTLHVMLAVHYSLHHKPNPDRLRLEQKKLQDRLAAINSSLNNVGSSSQSDTN